MFLSLFCLLCSKAQVAEDPQLARKALLPLAERMIEKHANENKMESEAGEML